MEGGKFIIGIIVVLSILTGFFTGIMYTMNYYNLTVTQTSVITIPMTKVITTTITTTVAAGNQNVHAAPILNTVFAYKSNVYIISSSGTIVSVYLPNNYVKYAGEIANFYSWYNPQYIRYVHSKYTEQNLPRMPDGDDENYLKFSTVITKYFHYDSQRAQTIQYNPQTKMPLQVLNDKKGICGDYMHFWALLEVAEGRKVTLVDMFAENKKVGHAFIIDKNGYIIENNGHILFNTDAAFILWYNYFREPLIVTYFYVDPNQGITSIKETTIKSVSLVVPTSVIKDTHTIIGIYNRAPYTATVFVNAVGNNISITSVVVNGNITYTKYIFVQGDVALIITTNPFGATTNGAPYNEEFYYISVVPDYLKFKNILNYNEINNTRIYTLQFNDNDTLIATSYMNKIIATRIIKNGQSIVGIFTYTANVLYS